MTNTNNSKLEAELRRAEDQRLAAMLAGDLAALGDLLAEDLRYTHSTGRVDDRQSLLELLGSGVTEYLALSHDFHSVVPEGRVAIVDGSMKLHLVSGGVEKHLETVTRAVWAHDGCQWKLHLFVGSRDA